MEEDELNPNFTEEQIRSSDFDCSLITCHIEAQVVIKGVPFSVKLYYDSNGEVIEALYHHAGRDIAKPLQEHLDGELNG